MISLYILFKIIVSFRKLVMKIVLMSINFVLINSAVMIEHEDGRKVILSATNKSQREAIAKRLLTPSTSQKPVLGCKKVYSSL